MASLDLGRFAGIAGALNSVFWRLVPEALFLPGFFLPAPKILEISSLSPDTTDLNEAAKSGKSVALQIAPAACLQRSVSLPKAALQQADAAIALQMRQTLPAAGKGLLWRSFLAATKDQTAEFQVFILKQSQIDALLEACGKARVELSSIGLADPKVAPFWTARTGAVSQRKIWLGLALLAGILPALWTVYRVEAQVSALNETAAAASQRISDLQTRLVAARDEANKAETETATMQGDLATFAAQTGRLAELADLTQTLPDSVWISELTITGNQLSMSGFSSGDVAEIVADLQGLAWVAAVQLEGPVSLDSQSGQSRFQLGLRIKTNEASP